MNELAALPSSCLTKGRFLCEKSETARKNEHVPDESDLLVNGSDGQPVKDSYVGIKKHRYFVPFDDGNNTTVVNY